MNLDTFGELWIVATWKTPTSLLGFALKTRAMAYLCWFSFFRTGSSQDLCTSLPQIYDFGIWVWNHSSRFWAILIFFPCLPIEDYDGDPIYWNRRSLSGVSQGDWAPWCSSSIGVGSQDGPGQLGVPGEGYLEFLRRPKLRNIKNRRRWYADFFGVQCPSSFFWIQRPIIRGHAVIMLFQCGSLCVRHLRNSWSNMRSTPSLVSCRLGSPASHGKLLMLTSQAMEEASRLNNRPVAASVRC